MDIGTFQNNITFYHGYEGEGEIELSLEKDRTCAIHIWDGYFEDLLGTPLQYDENWQGFTKDYQECIHAFGEDCALIWIEPDIYVKDLYQYRGKQFLYTETASCLELLIAFLEYAKQKQQKVRVQVL